MCQVRVYYVDANQLRIREIKLTGDGDWENGKLFNNQPALISKASGISANVVIWDYGAKYGQLKVYYTSDQGYVNVIYSNLNQGNWSIRSEINQ